MNAAIAKHLAAGGVVLLAGDELRGWAAEEGIPIIDIAELSGEDDR